MKSVLISIQPKWCELIASGKKTIEVRKTRPKIDPPFKCYIYCTLPPKEELFTHGCIREYANELLRLQDGRIVYDYGMRLCCDIEDRPYSQDNFLCKKVIGEFVCDAFITDKTFGHDSLFNAASCMSDAEIAAYCTNKEMFGWHISNLKIYDKPKELSNFYNKHCNYFYNGCCCCNEFCQWQECLQEGAMLCVKSLTRAPQSWCYAEETQDERI